MSARVLITGGTGFAGSYLVELLQQNPELELHLTTFRTQKAPLGTTPASLTATRSPLVHALDLTQFDQVKSLIAEVMPTQIYHLAAAANVGTSFAQADQILHQNTMIQLSLLEAVRAVCPAARVLVVGSAQEYDLIGHPTSKPIREDHPLGPANPYGVSKAVQDLLSLSYHYTYGLQVVRARPFNHIGRRQTTDFAVPAFAAQVARIEQGKQQEIRVGNLDAVRDFTDVRDVVQAYVLLMEKGQVGQAYNIGSGTGHSMREILELLCNQAEHPIRVVTDPARVRPLDVPCIVADSSRIAALGWRPSISLRSTLQEVLQEWRSLEETA